MTAPLSAAELATVARFAAGPDAPESLRERVAVAMFWTANPIRDAFPDYWLRVAGGEGTRDRYRELADAAIAVITGGAS